MKILLVRPPQVGLFGLTRQVEHEPLELEYLQAAFAAGGHEVTLFDRHCQRSGLKTVLRRVRPQVVCITGYIIQEPLMKRYARAVKRFDEGIRVVLGGSHVELNYANFYDSAADYLYHISGLGPLCRLMDQIAKGCERPQQLEGLCYRGDAGWVCTPKVVCHPQDLPLPDRSHFERYRHRYRYLSFHPLALVKCAYSCPYSCSFCYCTNMNGGAYRCRSVESLVEEIAGIDCENIHIVDDDFLVDERYLRAFVRLVREKGIRKRYMVYGRADFIAEHPQLMAELAGVGLALVMVGLEAVEDEALEGYDKGATLGHNEACVRVLNELGVVCAGLFIVHPAMGQKDFDKLYRWIRERRGTLTATVSVLTPMQGSREYEKLKGQMLDMDPTKQDLAHCLLQPKQMSLGRFYREYYKLSAKLFWATRRHPVYRAIGLRDVGYLLVSGARKLWRRVVV